MSPPASLCWISGCLLTFIGLAAAQSSRAEEGLRKGEEIYARLCVECHGEKGEGVADKADDPLYGDRSLASLARRIERTMPEDREDECVGEDAQAVAAYIYKAFYSEAARQAQHPVEAGITRLTVEQYRNSVADLLGQPDRQPAEWSAGEAGLKGEYFGTANFSGAKEKEGKDKFERRDAALVFSFGEGSPDNEVMGAEQFSIRWTGSVTTEDTGVYEFILKTPNGAKLSLNRDDPPLIDAWVSSGPEVREVKGSLFLLGGRSYPLMVEYFKFKEKTGSIELWWKTPQGTEEPVPAANLHASRVPETPVVSVPFPADDRSLGYERGSAVNRAWYDAVTDGALQAAVEAADRLPRQRRDGRERPEDSDRLEKVKAAARSLIAVAFRRPPSEEEIRAQLDPFFPEGALAEVAFKRVVMALLMSPRFLYPEVSQPETPDDWTVAARLALTLWDSVPDGALMQAAEQGQLLTPAGREEQARRMLRDARTREKLRGFFHHWLELKDLDTIAKDPAAFPEFGKAELADLRRSLDLFIERVVWQDSSDYRDLLRADWLMLNPRLAKWYGKEQELSGPGFQPVTFTPGERSGVITHPYLLTALAYFRNSSPIHRGVFLTRNIVGRQLKPPPEAIEFKDANFDPSFTMREKVTEITRPAACMGCHSTINPLGFSLENFDAVGRWRAEDNGKPVNPVSEFTGDDGENLRFARPADVAEFAIGSETAHRMFVRQLWNHLVKQPPAAYGAGTLDELVQGFAASEFNIQELMVRIALRAATRGMPPDPPKESTGP